MLLSDIIRPLSSAINTIHIELNVKSIGTVTAANKCRSVKLLFFWCSYRGKVYLNKSNLMHLSSLYTRLIYEITIYIYIYLARIPENKNKNEINSRTLYYRISLFLDTFFFKQTTHVVVPLCSFELFSIFNVYINPYIKIQSITHIYHYNLLHFVSYNIVAPSRNEVLSLYKIKIKIHFSSSTHHRIICTSLNF